MRVGLEARSKLTFQPSGEPASPISYGETPSMEVDDCWASHLSGELLVDRDLIWWKIDIEQNANSVDLFISKG
jgi:hypothetical protein